MSKTYLFRFEAADFDNTLFDMPKLSPIRGASMSYLLSSELVKHTLKTSGLSFKTIYTGASEGLFELTGEAGAVRDAAKAVQTALAQDDAATGVHSHLAYVTALVEGADTRAAAAAQALCNTRRMQGVCAPLPAFEEASRSHDEEGDRARPAVPGALVKGAAVSRAHKARHDFGRKEKKRLYNRIAPGVLADGDPSFVTDFEDMVKRPPTRGDGSVIAESLKSKVAVFFADGNRLGDARDKALAAGGLDGLGSFSTALSAHQSQLMSDIVGWLKAGAKSAAADAYVVRLRPDEPEFRFETLLWGGDEVMFVMPAWLGVEFAVNFFKWTGGWVIKNAPVTFSAGLVFCNHKTPIRQSKAIAEALVDHAKAVSRTEKDAAALQFEVFESLALPEKDFGGYRRRMYFANSAAADPDALRMLNRQLCVLGADGSATLAKGISALKSGRSPLPRSQLYALLRRVSEMGADQARHGTGEARLIEDYSAYLKRAGAGMAPSVAELEVMKPVTDFKATLAVSLAVIAGLWDYVDPLAAPAAGGDA